MKNLETLFYFNLTKPKYPNIKAKKTQKIGLTSGNALSNIFCKLLDDIQPTKPINKDNKIIFNRLSNNFILHTTPVST